jgi:lipopolysaccharide biosynthesis protein
VRRARPWFAGHEQPHVPLDGYYDLTEESALRRQVELAHSYGIHGFAHYHYWFDGKQLLQTPTDRFLGLRDLRLQFCLAWANESWSRRWDGQEHAILIQQRHPPVKERWELHFQYLVRAWTDDRAIRIDGKPLFLIYRPHRIEAIADLFDYWRERAADYGLAGLYFVAMDQTGVADELIKKHFDAYLTFQPHVARRSLTQKQASPWQRGLTAARRLLPSQMPLAKEMLERYLDHRQRPTLVDYDTVWREIVARPFETGITTFPSAFPSWDNSARHGRRAVIYHGASPEKFEFWLRRLAGGLTQNRPQERLLFINAWNEWSEGAHLEPDERHGYRWLEAVARVLSSYKDAEKT